MPFRLIPSLALILALASCTSMRSPVVPGAKPKDHGAIGATEGPAWKDGSLYFTDGKHINRMGPDGKTTVFRHNASNGLLFDKEGRLVACESGLRRVTRTEKDGSITVLADRFEGKRFNSPNDLCMDSKGRIYFTDPRYGSREGMEIAETRIGKYGPASKLGSNIEFVEGVYRIDRQTKLPEILSASVHDRPGVTRILCDGVERPNGVLVSRDDRYLYIADNNNNTRGGSRKLLRYTLDKNGDVTPSSRKVLFDWKNGRGPDGMKTDSAGRIYVAAARTRRLSLKPRSSRQAATSSRLPAACSTSSPPRPMNAATAPLAARMARRFLSRLEAISGVCRCVEPRLIPFYPGV